MPGDSFWRERVPGTRITHVCVLARATTSVYTRLREQFYSTLYLPLPHSVNVEALRSRFNPVQFGMIRAHVTQCREDEVSDLGSVASRLREISAVEVAMSFG